MTKTMLGAFAFLFGACWGSFLNVCISRWPKELSVVSPRSRCPNCEREIRWYENIPILGWILLGGKCAGCKQKISMQYPIVELTVALLWLACALYFDDWFTALRAAVFGTVMLGIAVTDAKHYLIPDGFTVFGLLWVIVTAFVALFVSTNPEPFVANPLAAIIGACTGAGVVAIVGWIGEVILKKEAMGFGDITLMAVAGAALGSVRALLTVFVAALLGAVAFLLIVYPIVWLRSKSKKQKAEMPLVPFGVFLAPASVILLLWGNNMINWYAGMLGVK